MAKNHQFYVKYVKRGLDFLITSLFLVLFWWLYLILALLVKIKLGSPIIFKQPRPGRNEVIFEMKKFRTMTNEKDENGNLLSDEKRLNQFGRWLRSTSLDELPEIIEIWTGKMSLVGPRPLLVDYLPYYTKEEAQRHKMRPGLTGWAQVNGRNASSWDEQLKQDVYYVKNCSFLLDCKILFMTVYKVIKKSDILMGEEIRKKQGRLDEERKDKV